MTIDQLLYVVSRIHNWDKSEHENVCRATGIILHCQKAMDANEEVEEMKSRGLSPAEMLKEAMEKRAQ